MHAENIYNIRTKQKFIMMENKSQLQKSFREFFEPSLKLVSTAVVHAKNVPNPNIQVVKNSQKKTTFYALPATCNSLFPHVKFQPNKLTFKWARLARLLEE
jgi:hypothetical protein